MCVYVYVCVYVCVCVLVKEMNYIINHMESEINLYCTSKLILCNNNNIFIYLFIAIGLSPGGSGYFTCTKYEIGY